MNVPGESNLKQQVRRPESVAALRSLIVTRQLNLPKQQETALRFLIDNPGDAAFGTYRTLAAASGVSTGSIRQLTQSLGLTGLRELRQMFRQSLRETLHSGG